MRGPDTFKLDRKEARLSHMVTSRFVLAGTFFYIAAGPAHAQPVILAPHRAVYDLALASSANDKLIEQAKGRIAFEFTGSACEGFTLKSRQVTQLSDGEGEAKLSDVRMNTWEDGKGAGFRFKNQTKNGPAITEQAEGKAERESGGEISVKLQRPRPLRLDLDGVAVFPSTHTRMLIESAKSGENFFSTRVFDGSEGGNKLFEAVAVIGKEVPVGSALRVDDVMKKAGLQELKRWPVTISYYEPGKGEKTPIYVMSYDLFENGISASLKFDFGGFTLSGALTTLDLLPLKTCK